MKVEKSKAKELLTLISNLSTTADNALSTRAKIVNVLDSVFAQSRKAANTTKSALSGKRVVKERNKEGLIATLDNLKNTGNNIFIVGGIRHFAPARAHYGDNLGELDMSDDQYELRDAINERPYAVLYPR